MVLFSCLGDVGSGKTLFATYLAYFDSHNSHRDIIANYEIRVPGWKRLKPEMLISIKKPTMAILDEAYAWLESRLSGRDINLYMSYILFQSRKRGIDIVLTDQLEETIDKRFRLLTNYRIECEAQTDGFYYEIWKRGKHGFSNKPVVKFLSMETAELYFPLYDSWELINPIDDKLLYKISEDKEETVGQVEKIIKKMLKIAPADKWSKGAVSAYCLRNKHPIYLAQLISDDLKLNIIKNL